MEAAGTLIVGAGLAGSATAMHLAALGDDGVVVVDPDLAGARSSSELNAGGVRATWWQPVNVELCAATIDFMARHREELGFREHGYLWLHGPERFAEAPDPPRDAEPLRAGGRGAVAAGRDPALALHRPARRRRRRHLLARATAW